ncbi:MAG: SAM-dependent methyltransferase [Acidobacteria bacterium]|nr:SAM-dependent methyltransferase [Acidobacteriota bacterium]
MTDPREVFGDIDIYLFDQILKGRFNDEMSVLDAGCGGGRNLVFFLRGGYEVFGIDRNPHAIASVRHTAKTLAPFLPPENFQVSEVEKTSFPDRRFDAVISSAVLHFAENERHFRAMLREMWRVLKPGGIFFARLASSIGIEDQVQTVGDGKYLLPDGSTRFLVDEELLTSETRELGGIWLEPLKTTNVQNMRCMSTWVLKKV